MESISTVASKLHWKRTRCQRKTGLNYRRFTLVQSARLTLQVTKILVPFKRLTKLGQSKNNDLGSIAGVLWGFDMLLEVLENARKEFITPENKRGHLATCIDHSWHLFNKYYTLTDDSRAYIMAATLDPSNKHEYFLQKWGARHLPDMRRKTESMFDEFRLSHGVAASLDIPNSPSHSDVGLIDDFDISEWQFGGAMVPKESELQRYLKSPLMILGGRAANKEFDILEWWRVNQGEYPILSCIAIELYAIPGMSAEVERVFSRFVPLFFWFKVAGRNRPLRIEEIDWGWIRLSASNVCIIGWVQVSYRVSLQQWTSRD